MARQREERLRVMDDDIMVRLDGTSEQAMCWSPCSCVSTGYDRPVLNGTIDKTDGSRMIFVRFVMEEATDD